MINNANGAQSASGDDAVQRLTADISARLRAVCGHLSDEDFAELVLDIARVRIRYDPLFPGSVSARMPAPSA